MHANMRRRDTTHRDSARPTPDVCRPDETAVDATTGMNASAGKNARQQEDRRGPVNARPARSRRGMREMHWFESGVLPLECDERAPFFRAESAVEHGLAAHPAWSAGDVDPVDPPA
jgi:hypothetical protein